MTKTILCTLAATALAVGISAQAPNAPKLQLKDLPPAVQKAVQAETKGATVVSIVKENENGTTLYEVETMVNGKTRDLMFATNGNVEIVEQELAPAEVPAAAMKVFNSSGGKIVKLESVTKGKTMYYEALVQKNGKTTEVEATADGKPVKQ